MKLQTSKLLKKFTKKFFHRIFRFHPVSRVTYLYMQGGLGLQAEYAEQFCDFDRELPLEGVFPPPPLLGSPDKPLHSSDFVVGDLIV